MSSDKIAALAGMLAELYDRYLVPLNFAPYAEVVADRAKALLPRRVLETALAPVWLRRPWHAYFRLRRRSWPQTSTRQ